METTASALLDQINLSLKPLGNLNKPFYFDPNFLGAMLASVAALGIAIFSEQLRGLWRKTNLTVQRILPNEQGNGNSIHYRLLIVNKGSYPAKDVEVYVDKIYENNRERRNFLPVPLRWAHARAYMTAGVYRNIHPNQSVLLDFCELIKSNNLLKLSLAAGDEVPDYCILHGGDTKVAIKIYQEDGKTITTKFKISWQTNFNIQISVI
ncbi:MAG: hypothetical protein HY424_00260 [Candidatus Levybacteria bacterium]|nr:hypothetical protein [Candidatus Levybacteria bacterium]